MAKTNKPSATKAQPRKKTRPASQGTSRASGKKSKTAAPKPAARGKIRQGKATTKPATKKPTVKKTAVKKTAVKKAAVKKTAAKKTVAKKTVAKKTVAKKTAAKKATVKKPGVKKAVKKKAPAVRAANVRGATKASATVRTPAKKAASKKAPLGKKAPAKVKVEAKHGKQQPSPPRQATAPKTAEPVPTTVIAQPEPKQAPARKPLKQAYQMEFYLKASQASLYELISTPSGFSEWFCDDVDVADNIYTFKWGDDTETAQCIAQRFGQFTRFRWLDDQEEDPLAFFELRIRIDSMTNETCLVVTDHAWPKDIEEERALWESQVQTLIRVLGA